MSGFTDIKIKTFLLIFLVLNLPTISEVRAETEWVKVPGFSSDYINVLESTPAGLLAGEYYGSSTTNPPPYNGVLFSKDFGENWNEIGLNKRGILDLKYFDGKIYATTYYTVDGTRGLFLSENFGESWDNIGPSVSPTKIDRDKETIYLGTRHYGVYTSHDEGETWEKIWEGSGTALRIQEIQSSEDITFVSTLAYTYKTLDNGITWEKVEDFDLLTIGTICINGNTIFAGSTGKSGLYVSRDKGITWERVLSFGNYSVDKIVYLEGIYYAGRYNPETCKYSIFKSLDDGESWSDIGPNISSIDKVNSLATLYAKPPYLLATVSTKGAYKSQTEMFAPRKIPFLEIPWNYQNESELTDNITSYFDHSYPLLGYSYFYEPHEYGNTTLNFLGYEDTQPNLYYSSHSGTDFGLKYGTEILAPASGYASYYYCEDCGNSIKIDHGNGYQTTYMHLQDEDLITKTDPIWVNNNDIIGKVGLTGRTTGPHLHFEVLKDLNMDRTFSNDFPMGRTDPFGWQTSITDPWEEFVWSDILGSHSGTDSSYIWNALPRELSETISAGTEPGDASSITLDNKYLEFLDTKNFFTAKITSYINPLLNQATDILSYIKNTSFIFDAIDQTKNKIGYMDNFINISIEINPKSLQNIDLDTIGVYQWDKLQNLWEKIPSTFDEQLSKIQATTNHPSWFAVFGEKIDSVPPETHVAVSGSQDDNWYTEYPLITLVSDEDDLDFTVYSIDNGNLWHNYNQPFYIEKDGIVNLIYKSQDNNENMERENNYTININTEGIKTDRIKVKDAKFTLQ